MARPRPTARTRRSPYELTAGSSLDDLHPALRTYFAGLPAGSRGYGSGVFEVVGTPRRWLWPALHLLAGQGMLFPVWEKNVPFTVVNAPIIDRAGKTAVVAVRRFHFLGGARTMIDAITAESTDRDGLVDHLGFPRRFRVRLASRVVRGEFHLRSTAFEIRIGRHHLRVPGILAPRVSLIERFDDHARLPGTPDGASGAQRVTVIVEAPLLGRLYEYTGAFRYEVRAEPSSAERSGAVPAESSSTAARKATG
ncbi:DUF4166 domain-containing protein [Herbiconiux sp.]|uniref:DUF4166 domain-containing protein n=1 Tax=Herbiconiux sp. TaxID=1871186 RepID=UPI0025C40DD9|nr:DUF4166 domain-containing protein [Herbiconiux sp.]